MVGVVRVTYLLSMAEITPGSSFEPNKPREQKLGYVSKGANSMAASGLVFRSDLVGTGRAISILFGIIGVRSKQSCLVGPEFKSVRSH